MRWAVRGASVTVPTSRWNDDAREPAPVAQAPAAPGRPQHRPAAAAGWRAGAVDRPRPRRGHGRDPFAGRRPPGARRAGAAGAGGAALAPASRRKGHARRPLPAHPGDAAAGADLVRPHAAARPGQDPRGTRPRLADGLAAAGPGAAAVPGLGLHLLLDPPRGASLGLAVAGQRARLP